MKAKLAEHPFFGFVLGMVAVCAGMVVAVGGIATAVVVPLSILLEL